jgi:hypothetical protein
MFSGSRRGEIFNHTFVVEDMLELTQLMGKPIDPFLFGIMDGYSIPNVARHVKKCIAWRIDCYKNKNPVMPDIPNALSFFLAFLKGQFVSYTNRIILVHGTGFKIWDLTQDVDDETVLHGGLRNEPCGTFAYPGCGFWHDNFNCEQGLSKPEKHGLMIVGNGNQGYEVYNSTLG